jgi:ribosomal protein S18 acetylase RimI-like enzyme
MESTEFKTLEIVNITRDYLSRNLDKFHALESNWTEIGEQPWNESNFLLELPYKWELSFAVENKGEIFGYLIGSEIAANTARVNKIIVGREYRKNNVGTILMKRFETACFEKGLYDVDLKAIVDNKAANNFYLRLGYKRQPQPVKGIDGLFRYVYKKRLKREIKKRD